MADPKDIPVGSEHQPEVGGNQEDQVSYDTHRRLLGEKKRVQEERDQLRKRLDDIEAQRREQEAKELEKQGEFKKLLELREKELSDHKAMLAKIEEDRKLAKKVVALRSAIGMPVKDEYLLAFAETEKILTTEDGSIDPLSVSKVAEEFKKAHPSLLGSNKPNNPGLPQNAPNGSGSISYESWLTLPYKEKAARLKDVIAAEK